MPLNYHNRQFWFSGSLLRFLNSLCKEKNKLELYTLKVFEMYDFFQKILKKYDFCMTLYDLQLSKCMTIFNTYSAKIDGP